MKKFIGFIALTAMVLLVGTSLNQAGTTREDRGTAPGNQSIDRTDGPSGTLDVPGLFNALKNWILGNPDGRGTRGQNDRNGTLQEGPDSTDLGVGGCRGVGGCGGWR